MDGARKVSCLGGPEPWGLARGVTAETGHAMRVRSPQAGTRSETGLLGGCCVGAPMRFGFTGLGRMCPGGAGARLGGSPWLPGLGVGEQGISHAPTSNS